MVAHVGIVLFLINTNSLKKAPPHKKAPPYCGGKFIRGGAFLYEHSAGGGKFWGFHSGNDDFVKENRVGAV